MSESIPIPRAALGEGASSSFIEDNTAGMAELMRQRLAIWDATIANLEKRPDDPAALAQYQRAMSIFAIVTEATNNVGKSVADLDKEIIRTF